LFLAIVRHHGNNEVPEVLRIEFTRRRNHKRLEECGIKGNKKKNFRAFCLWL
jgi:hypothetical protein